MTNFAQLPAGRVIIGVDTHKDIHVAVTVDHLGRRLEELAIPNSRAGYGVLLSWAMAQGEIEAFAVEGTASYGAGLTRSLRGRGFAVVEVSRPDRRTRHSQGKSDPIDAEAAARAVLSGKATAVPKAGDDNVEIIRMLRVARVGAVKARTAAINSLLSLVVTAPSELVEELKGVSNKQLVERAARFRPGPVTTTIAGAKAAMASLARRIKAFEAEIAALDADLAVLVAQVAPDLVAIYGVGTDSAGALLVSAGDNPRRLKSEAAAAKLWGVAPLPATSGKTVSRHRLNRGGDRQANAALFRIVTVRMYRHGLTRDYVQRRIKEGRSKREIIRCLKRYVAREVYCALVSSGLVPHPSP